MKLLFGLTLILLTFWTFIGPVNASCEGTSGGDILSAWYHTKDNRFILETGDPTQQGNDHDIYRDYMIQENDKRITIASMHRITWPIREPDGSAMDKYSGKGDVGLRVHKNDDISLTPSALAFQQALFNQKIPNSLMLNPNDTPLAFDQIQISIHKIIEANLGYQKISPLKSCPYALKPQHPLAQTTIYRLFFRPTYAAILMAPDGHETNLGLLPVPFPGDDRSTTTVTPQGKCWGLPDQKPLLIAFHWDWECQGAGDLFFTPRQLGAKNP